MKEQDLVNHDIIECSDDAVISARNVSKKFSLNLKSTLKYGVADIVKELFFIRKNEASAKLRKDEFWALKDVSFELKRGESVAIIGDNGAGKSTLLKLLYGLIRPDAGEIHIRGSIGAMIELGVGFDPVLSGRENIFLRASLLGLPRDKTTELIEEIVDFAELEQSIDSPMQFYSSGMIARLSFAVSICLKPSIILVDEVLTVGDLDFQRKCINQILKYVSNGGSLILVSHAPSHVQSVCQNCIILENGKIAYQGSALEAINEYLRRSSEKKYNSPSVSKNTIPTDKKPIVIKEVFIKPLKGNKIYTNENVQIIINYQASKDLSDIGFAFMIFSMDDVTCITGGISSKSYKIKQGVGKLSCKIHDFPLMPGDYLLKISIYQSSNYIAYANFGHENPPLRFSVADSELNLSTNSYKILNQLITLNVDWT